MTTRSTALVLLLLAAAGAASALDRERLDVRSVAANCAQCHGTGGKPAAGSALPPLAGQSREELAAQLQVVKSGTRAGANPAPMLTNTCYSFVDDRNGIHAAGVHEYVAAETTFKSVAGSGGLSAGPTELEGRYAMDWARNIWTDIVG